LAEIHKQHGTSGRRAAIDGVEEEEIMTQGNTRLIFRSIHLVSSIPIVGYIYSPFDKIPQYAPATRFFFLPVMVLSGLWMWKGHVVRRLFSRRVA
jgi:hypothetical protein